MQLSPIADLFKPEIINPILDVIEKHVKSIPVDATTDKGRKDCIALAAKVCKSKTFIESSRKKHLEDIQKIVKTVNASSNASQARLQTLQDETRKPVTDWEDIEKARVAALEEKLTVIAGYGTKAQAEWQILSITAMREMLALVAAKFDWQEYGKRGELTEKTAADQITAAITQREKYEAEQAELTQLRQEAAERAAAAEAERVEREHKAREEAAAKAATEKAESEAKEAIERAEREKRESDARAAKAIEDARLAAEKAEADRKAAELKAEQDRIAAEAKAEADRQAAIEAERQKVAAEQEAEKSAKEKRERNKRHVAKVNREATADLMTAGPNEITEEQANAIIDRIAKGLVQHVTITY
jgi:hypothetical protein